VSAISSRFSRGRSTPARRAIRAVSLSGRRASCGGLCVTVPLALRGPRPPTGGPPPRGRVVRLSGCRAVLRVVRVVRSCGWSVVRLALALLVPRGRAADDHDAAVATDDLALVADALDAGVDLHCSSLSPSSYRPGCRAAVTFRRSLLVAVDDPTSGEVVRRELDLDPVAREDLDAVAPHLPGGVAERLDSVVELDLEDAAAKRLDDLALELDLLFLLRYDDLLSSRSATRRTPRGPSCPRASRTAPSHPRRAS